jgi:hypothetical protein
MGRASRRRRERRIQKRRELATTVHDWSPSELGTLKPQRRNTETQHGETGSTRTSTD